MNRAFACLCLALLVASPAYTDEVSTSGETPIIRIGVRTDARPFAWHDPSTGAFSGFLVDLCTSAVTRAGFPFRQVPVDATQRAEILRTKETDLDLLCDPTTISLARLDFFVHPPMADRLRFSPIVFVANGVWVRNPDAKLRPLSAPPKGVTCLPDAPTRGAGAEGQGEAPSYLTAGFVVGTTAEALLGRLLRENKLDLAKYEAICPVVQTSHVDGIKDFCAGKLAYYFGDLDIVRETANDLVARGMVESCEFDHTPVPISYEPYALIVTDRTAGFRSRFIASLYAVFSEQFSDSSTVDHFFDLHFGNLEKSPFLDALFRINRLPPG